MKTLIAVITARPRKAWRDAIRATWLPLVPKDKADVFFFMGRGDNVSVMGDEILLDCDDTYKGLPEKVREVIRWAKAHNYDFMLKCDDDVVLQVEKLLASGYEKHDYTARANRPPNARMHPGCWVPVGFNYWMSKRCMGILANADFSCIEDNDDERWVAIVLHQNGIDVHDDKRYQLHMGQVYAERPKIPYRPLRPPPLPRWDSEVFSWSIFMETNAGDTIPLETKIAEFHKTFAKLYQTEGV